MKRIWGLGLCVAALCAPLAEADLINTRLAENFLPKVRGDGTVRALASVSSKKRRCVRRRVAKFHISVDGGPFQIYGKDRTRRIQEQDSASRPFYSFLTVKGDPIDGEQMTWYWTMRKKNGCSGDRTRTKSAAVDDL